MSMSLDGFVTGPTPRAGLPLGEGGQRLHDWMFNRRGADPGRDPEQGKADVNDTVARELFATTGGVLMGRRMFDLGIGPRGDTPFPAPCFVLTHQPREDLVMASGTFTFISEGLTAAVDRAAAAAGGRTFSPTAPASPSSSSAQACSTRSSCTWCRSCSTEAAACSSTSATPATSSS
jgi:dihydrofolate reductase